MPSRTTQFLAKAADEDGCEVFVALTDAGTVRFGWAGGGPMREVPSTHPAYAIACAAAGSYDEIEATIEAALKA